MEENKNKASQEERKQEVHKLFEAIKSISVNQGICTVGVPADLIERGEAFFLNHGKALASALTSSGVQASTSEAVLDDYRDVLTGRYKLSATLEQMREVTDKCGPESLYSIYKVDGIGAFCTLFALIYRGRLGLYGEYKKYVSMDLPTATLETRREFFKGCISGTAALNMYWLFRQGLIKEDDLIERPEDGKPAPFDIFYKALNNVNFSAYLTYYVVARYALGITEEEAARIITPIESSGQEGRLRKLAEDLADLSLKKTKQAGEALNNRPAQGGEEVDAAADLSETIAEEIKKDVCIPRIFSAVCGEPRIIRPEGSQSDVLLQKFFDDIKHNDKILAELDYLTDGQAVKVFSGIQKMIDTKPYTKNGTKRVYSLGYTEFSALCEGERPSGSEVKSNIAILDILSGKKFRVPSQKISYSDASGKMKCFDPNERNEAVYVQLFNVPILVEGANSRAIIEIEERYAANEACKYIPSVFFDLLKEAQSDTERHAYYQMITKDRKKKEDFIDAAFGYSATAVWAKETKNECKRQMRELIERSPELSAGGLSADEGIEAQRTKIRTIAQQWSAVKSAAGSKDVVAQRTAYICDYSDALDKLQEAAEEEAKMWQKRKLHKKRKMDAVESWFAKAETRGLIKRKKRNDKETFWWGLTNAGQEEQIQL